ncbi:unnamed protein product [Larinioides sclopetarius]|uniref:Uncharacterized protein n=1 Tax=Larinioides sclopetarius TaxID=280406 RepID=A0AAV1ZJK1_9ARAC
MFQMTQIETLPVTSKQLRQKTAKDEELGPLLRALGEGQNLQGREAQYTIEDGCILYGQRVCIPKRYQKNVLDELHAGHLGIVGDKVAVRVYRAANSKWKFGKIVNRDGALHYTIEVQGTLVRRHVDQIRPVGDQVQETDQIPNIRHRFSASDFRESDPNIQHAETADNPTPQVPSEEQEFSPRSTEPSTDIRAQDSPVSDAQPKNPSRCWQLNCIFIDASHEAFSRSMQVMGPEPCQEGRMWVKGQFAIDGIADMINVEDNKRASKLMERLRWK